MVENSVEKVENLVGNPGSFSQNRWKTRWKKLKDHARGDKNPGNPLVRPGKLPEKRSTGFS